MGRYQWPDGSTVDVLDYCEELDKWRGDDFEFLAQPDEGPPIPQEQLNDHMSWIFGH